MSKENKDAPVQTDDNIDPNLADALKAFQGEEISEDTPPKEESKPEDTTGQGDDLLKSIGFKGKSEEKPENKSDDKAEEKPEHKSDDKAEEELTPPKDEANRANWDKLKGLKDEAVSRVKELEAQLAERGDDASLESMRARLAEVEKENERFSSRLKEVDFQSHPEYYNKYEAPLETAKAELKSLADDEGVDINVDALMELRGREFGDKVTEILDDLSRFSGDEFSRVARNAMKVIRERDAIATDSENWMKEATEKSQAETRAVFDHISAQFRASFDPLEVPADADDEVKAEVNAYNADLAATTQVAEQIAFGAMDNEQVSRIANEAAQYRFLVSRGLPRLVQNAGAKIAALEAELAGIKGAGPEFRPTSPVGDSSTRMEDMSNEDAAEMAFRS